MKNRKLEIILGFGIGFFSISMFVWHFLLFNVPANHFDKYPAGTIFYGRNVVSAWANFLFFTNQTLLIFAGWCFLIGIHGISRSEKLRDFVYSENTMTFVFTNYLITFLLYTIMELLGSGDFGFYGTSIDAWFSFFRNIAIHYILFFVCAALFFKLKPTKEFSNKTYLYSGIYLLIYYLVARIIGRFCFHVEWYPYMFFHSKVLWEFLGLGPYNQFVAIALMIIVMIIITGLYFLSLFAVRNVKALFCKEKK